jgi:hypothetical protein
METKKMMATFAILMIVLGVAGFAYAHWEKIVTIDGSVTTGTLHVTPSFHMEIHQDKPVASYGYEVYPEENYMEVWLDNVFPELWAYGWIDLENDGSIPVHLVACDWEGNGTLSIVYVGPVDGYELYEVYDGEALIANLYLSYNFPDATNTDPFQIDPGSTAYIEFWLYFKEDLPQNAYYWFHIELTFWNWNESPAAGQPS